MFFKDFRIIRAVASVTVMLSTLGMLAACGDEPRTPTAFVSDGPNVLVGSANATVASSPEVRVEDQRRRGLPNVLVRWTVSADGGSVVNDSVRTDGAGVATSGGWRLGTKAGTQTLTATISGLPPVVFLATVSPGPPFVLARQVPETQNTVVNTLVAEPLSVRVIDAFDNLVPNAPVTFRVVSGGGVIVGDTVRVSDANGVASIDGWRIGTQTSVAHTVAAQTAGIGSPVLFRAAPLAEVAVTIEPASAQVQNGVPLLGVGARPAMRSRDQYGNPTGGVTIVFTPAPGSGSVTGNTRQTVALDGVARAGSWTLGEAAEQTLVATSPQFPAESFVFRANAVNSVFSIETVFIKGEPSPRNRRAVETAVERWRNVIAGELVPVQVFASANDCGPGVPAISDTIQNVRIYINFDSIDGRGRVLGRAGPCFIRSASGIPVVGFVELDTADLAALNESGTLDDVMTHEFGHVLGLQRFTWGQRDLVVNAGGPDPYYQGAAGREQFAAVGGGTYLGIPVPLENTGGAGTRESHWRISVLRRELMVGFAQPGGMPLSRLTVGSLSDLGYVVRPDNSEQFTVPVFGSAAFGAMTMPTVSEFQYGDDDWPSAIWSIDQSGRRQLVRAGDWRVSRRQPTRGGGR